MEFLSQRITAQRVIVGAWALWYSVVISTNATDILKTWGVLPETFGWVSNNYNYFVGGSGMEGAMLYPVIGLFLGGYAWEVATTALLWRALVVSLRSPERMTGAARAAFTLALGFWGTFMVLTEVSVAKTPPLYLELFTGLAASLVAVELLGSKRDAA